ncbi:bifunctional phosphopantothenoylcysteine decarboxylase/phosphopantothenate--cysteine ligase CoaBC [Microlunatus panaciterrae]|uniref:Coenzyme A biosynthesis bifunctional protein CoaBC n=1 Tax=Microlunatus panaciterrae TaxID=400768 RepID=A0ABS2RE35_9ACTN|nr:bifunctional phosphopantothenoylcysteine decarboxylase/phosphopantothenate--cysteine ligase CoaBC [Microlunatus panaciterrae]MBM7797250.1 phosphopantothenoylcysteine decarboxylase/phosphopantothenate--cysteine ligase [Microlunatus panaciterrae]
MSRIVLGVAGGIAAYKACELTRRFTEAGHEVTVVPTEAALRFVGSATWEALSGRPVHTGVFDDVPRVPHVALGKQAELVLVAPATADLLARAASGRADDLLTNILLTARCPVVFAPAMHTEMWLHPATVANVESLRSRGTVVIDPDSGRLTGSDTGPGRLPDPAELFAIAQSVLADPDTGRRAASRDLRGLRIVVSAGGTREHLDPVRFVGNASSGLMGWALARAAVLRGAEVRLVAANVSLPPPAGVTLEQVTSTEDLHQAMTRAAKDADLVVMAAAPADFTPADSQQTKIKKSSGTDRLRVELVQTTDILAGLVRDRTDQRQLIVGFAAETAADHGSLLQLGRDKLARKGCDLLVLNAVGHGKVFGQQTSEITLLTPAGAAAPVAGSKDMLAHEIWDEALRLRAER